MQIIEQAGPTRNEDTMMGTIHPWSGEAGRKNGAGPLKRVNVSTCLRPRGKLCSINIGS